MMSPNEIGSGVIVTATGFATPSSVRSIGGLTRVALAEEIVAGPAFRTSTTMKTCSPASIMPSLLGSTMWIARGVGYASPITFNGSGMSFMYVPCVAGSPFAQRALPSGIPVPQMAMLVGTSLASTLWSWHCVRTAPAGTEVVELGSSQIGASSTLGAKGRVLATPEAGGTATTPPEDEPVAVKSPGSTQ